jgi:hypothetical protein
MWLDPAETISKGSKPTSIRGCKVFIGGIPISIVPKEEYSSFGVPRFGKDPGSDAPVGTQKDSLKDGQAAFI